MITVFFAFSSFVFMHLLYWHNKLVHMFDMRLCVHGSAWRFFTTFRYCGKSFTSAGFGCDTISAYLAAIIGWHWFLSINSSRRFRPTTIHNIKWTNSIIIIIKRAHYTLIWCVCCVLARMFSGTLKQSLRIHTWIFYMRIRYGLMCCLHATFCVFQYVWCVVGFFYRLPLHIIATLPEIFCLYASRLDSCMDIFNFGQLKRQQCNRNTAIDGGLSAADKPRRRKFKTLLLFA